MRLLYEGKYTRYAESTARGLVRCMEQLIRDYDGSLLLMVEDSDSEEQLSKRLQKLYGVGPKVAEIFMRETEEIFAQRNEWCVIENRHSFSAYFLWSAQNDTQRTYLQDSLYTILRNHQQFRDKVEKLQRIVDNAVKPEGLELIKFV